MRGPFRRRTRRAPAEDPEIDRALEAMSAPELRAAMRDVIDGLDEGVRAEIIDTLIARATKATSGWKPSRPSQRIIDDAKSFAQAARQIAYADPEDVTEHLRRATKAFHAGDHASARAVFEAILPPIAVADIDLGQHELVEEVLGVDARACVAQYAASVYTTTPLRDRADAVLQAVERVEGVGTLSSPIKDMEDVSAGALPDLGAFLPLWVKRLGRFRPSKEEWETDHERWVREAVFRADGVDGLERIARKTKRPQACLAWCDALAEQGDWVAALRAYDAAAMLVGKSHWKGELLDGAAAERVFSQNRCCRTVSAVRLNIMRVTIQLPEDISAALGEQWDDVPRRSLEAIAVEGYRTGALTESQVRRLLELDTRFQVHALLKKHHVPLQYTSADIEDDLRAHRELGILPEQ